MTAAAWFLLSCAGCPSCDDGTRSPRDADGDGHLSQAHGGDDCDDDDPSTYPGAPEECTDGVDHDCDGDVGLCVLGDPGLTFASDKAPGVGTRVDQVEDLEGDGLAETLVTSNLSDWPVRGGAWLLFSSAGREQGRVDLELAVCRFFARPGPRSSPDWYGVFDAEFIGDVDGGGSEDLLAGSMDLGDAAIFFGETLPCPGSSTFDEADVVFQGGKYFGGIVAGGDVTGDGRSDPIVGMVSGNGAGWGNGALYVFDGASIEPGVFGAGAESRLLIAGTGEGSLGMGGACTGDVDADGLADILVGDETTPGTVHLLLAAELPDDGIMSIADASASFEGEMGGDVAFFSRFLGDVDGDGAEDFLIIAPGHSPSQSYLWFGRGVESWGVESDADADVQFYGKGGASPGGGSAGDLDADGLGDIFVYGGRTDDHGRANFYYGASIPASGTLNFDDADVRFTGESAQMNGGLAGGKDVDGDGIGDTVLGDVEVGTYDKFQRAGRAYMVFGW